MACKITLIPSSFSSCSRSSSRHEERDLLDSYRVSVRLHSQHTYCKSGINSISCLEGRLLSSSFPLSLIPLSSRETSLPFSAEKSSGRTFTSYNHLIHGLVCPQNRMNNPPDPYGLWPRPKKWSARGERGPVSVVFPKVMRSRALLATPLR